jgi:hypothetical protein
VNTAALPRLSLYPINFIRLGKFGLASVGVLCATLLFGLLTGRKPNSAGMLYGALVFACAVQIVAVALQGQTLGRGVSVLQLQRAPAALWRAWLRQWLLSVTRYWAVLGAAIALVFLSSGSPAHWLAAPALLSLVLCVGIPAVLARAGLLPRRPGMALEAAALALVLYLVAASQLRSALDVFTTLPPLLLAPCALAWPVLAYRVMASKGDALRTVTGRQTNVLRRLRDAVARWAGRFQPLHLSAADRTAYPVDRRTLLVIAVMQNVIFFAQLLPVRAGDDATAVRLSRLALICAVCFNALLVRDLHWRSLLLPGGTQLRRLGTRIVLSTMAFQAPMVLAIAVGSALMSRVSPWDFHILASVAIPLAELAACTSLATMARALPPFPQKAAGAALLLAMAYAYVPGWLKLDVPQLTWRVGPAYVLLLAAVAAGAVAIGNRCWTPQRLLNALTIR